MIAEVGGIVNVSGSRIATPLAPPRPGSTPMTVPSAMPITATRRLYGVIAMEKPCSRFSTPTRSVPEPRLEGSLRHRHQEPGLEDEERRDGNAHRDGHHEEPRVAADPAHVEAHVAGRGDVEPDELHQDHPRRRGPQDLEDGGELRPLDKRLLRAREIGPDDGDARDRDEDRREPEREEAALWPFDAPADAEPGGGGEHGGTP